MKRSCLLVLCSCLFVLPLSAQTSADSSAIRATALDYIDGWWAGDAERMERSLHPDLAKRIINVNPQNNRNILGHQSAMTLVQAVKRGGGKETPVAQRKSDVKILDIFGNTSSVRVDAGLWIDYLHVAKWNGRWMIVNVLWELTPPR